MPSGTPEILSNRKQRALNGKTGKIYKHRKGDTDSEKMIKSFHKITVFTVFKLTENQRPFFFYIKGKVIQMINKINITKQTYIAS